jgi:hypothetical protein
MGHFVFLIKFVLYLSVNTRTFFNNMGHYVLLINFVPYLSFNERTFFHILQTWDKYGTNMGQNVPFVMQASSQGTFKGQIVLKFSMS